MDPQQLHNERVHCSLDGLEQVNVIRNLTYLTVEGKDLQIDVYQPADMPHDAMLPTVLFVHGEAPWELVQDVRNWGQYRSWGMLAAASGFIGIVICRRPSEGFTRLPEVAGDTDAAIAYIREHASELCIDPDRLGLWVCSAGGPAGLGPIMNTIEERPYLRCLTAYYTALDLRPHKELLEYMTVDQLNLFSPLYHLERSARVLPPTLVVKAAQDSPFFNEPIDRFAAEILPNRRQFEYLVHEEGRHGFDVRDAVPRTDEIVRATLAFLRRHLFG